MQREKNVFFQRNLNEQMEMIKELEKVEAEMAAKEDEKLAKFNAAKRKMTKLRKVSLSILVENLT